MEGKGMERFRAASGRGTDWPRACDACISGLTDGRGRKDPPPAASLGFVYASDPHADALDLIAQRLAAATGVRDWVGTGGAAVCSSGAEHAEGGTIVALVASLPAGSFRLVDGLRDDAPDLERRLAGWAAEGAIGCGIVHGDPRHGGAARTIARISAASGAFLVGGLSSAQGSPLQLAGRPTEGGISGVLLSPAVPLITGLSQGCTPIGRVHEVSASQGSWVLALDGRPALAVLEEEIGEVLARNPERIAGYIHAALPQAGSDRADYVVRPLLAIDARRAILAIGDELRRGDRLLFVKRDGAAAQADLRRMLGDLRARAAGRPIRGALYHSCVARGANMFGPDSAELRIIEAALGEVPLAGFFTSGEIYRDRLYGYTGVLTLFL
jgi:small ligand-binding sensory domain FIST